MIYHHGVSLSEQHNDFVIAQSRICYAEVEASKHTHACAQSSPASAGLTQAHQFPPGNINKGDMKGSESCHLLVKDEIFVLNKTHIVDTTRRFWS